MATFFNKRKPKRVGRDESRTDSNDEADDSGPVVRRPTANAPKNKSKLRLSFNPGESENGEQPHLQALPRVNISQTVLKPIQDRVEPQDRPSYSKDYLQELRNSTPTTPKDLSTYNSSAEDDADEAALDVTGKFGQSRIASSSIPSAAEIQEKKDRRARLAKEQGAEDFIPLEDYDSDGEFKPQRMRVELHRQRDHEKDTRLVREDEDIAEGFDDFIEDSGRVTLSKKGLRQQMASERAAMRAQIEEAEDSSDEDSDAELNHNYEAAQTSHGMDGMARKKMQTQKPKQPNQLAPIPKLSTVINRVRGQVQELEMRRASLVKRKADIQKEKSQITIREEHIQKLLTEAGEEFDKLRNEMLESKGVDISKTVNGSGSERGLESIGGTPGP